MTDHTTPKSHPILFSGAMVRAVLDGSKTQTRRIVKPQPDKCHDGEPYWFVCGYRAWTFRPSTVSILHKGGNPIACPYGQPGDRLWVREAHYLTDDGHSEYAVAAADEHAAREHLQAVEQLPADFPADVKSRHMKLRPSIHMPRWASRITLEITDVRVERLQDISRGDAMAEGCPFPNIAKGDDPRQWYEQLWGQINGPDSWAANPWVWAVSFKRITT